MYGSLFTTLYAHVCQIIQHNIRRGVKAHNGSPSTAAFVSFAVGGDVELVLVSRIQLVIFSIFV